jgi:hypothetical protein
MQERLDGLEELTQLNKEQETAKGLSQAARKERDDVYRELKKEWSDFKYICRIAFEGADNPQYKELVGIVEYSEGYVRKKQEETPAQEPQEPEEPQEPQELQEPQMN